MLPTLWPHEWLSVAAATDADLTVGTIVVFSQGGRLVVHRIVGRAPRAQDPLLLTRGDAQARDDGPLGGSAVLGIVTGVRRFGAERPLRRRLSPPARALAALLRRSGLARGLLCRLHSALTGAARGAAVPVVPNRGVST